MSDELADVEVLEAEFPQWRFGAKWSAAGSGPDGRFLVAWREGMTLTASDADEMRRKIREAEGS